MEDRAGRGIEVGGASITLRQDKLLHIDFKSLDELLPKTAKEILKASAKLCAGQKIFTLITVNNYMQIGAETRQIWAGQKNKSVAEAMVVKPTTVRLVGNFYLQVNKPIRPTKMFRTEEPAVKWLYTFLKK
jgi:hypothetical protein